jgi:hypothetical protein
METQVPQIEDFTKLKQMLSSKDKELEGLGFNILCNNFPTRREYKEFRANAYSSKKNNIHLKFHRRLRREVNRNYVKAYIAAAKVESRVPQN